MSLSRSFPQGPERDGGPLQADHRQAIGFRRSVIFGFALPAVALLLTVNDLSRQAKGQAPRVADAQAPRPWDQNPGGLRIYIWIWAGLKSHLPGQHDYPQFLADWSKLLAEHGAVVDGALHVPAASDLGHTDVVIIYKRDAGYVSDEEKAALEAYVKRGGGLVSIRDSLCGPDPTHFATLVGGAKRHGEINYTLGAPITYTVTDPSDPFTT